MDIFTATSVGIALIIATGLTYDTTHLSASTGLVTLCVAMVAITFVDMVFPTTDGHNGLLWHLLLRYTSGILLAWLLCFPNGTSNMSWAWTLMLVTIMYVCHGFLESYVFRRVMASRHGESSETAPPMLACVRLPDALRTQATATCFICIICLVPDKEDDQAQPTAATKMVAQLRAAAFLALAVGLNSALHSSSSAK